MVSRIDFDAKEQECIAKDEQIQVDFDWLILFLIFVYLKTKDFTSKNSSFGTFTSFERHSSWWFSRQTRSNTRSSWREWT